MKNLISITLVVILCATILLGMSSLVSAATTGNSLPDFIDFSGSYSLADNWGGASNATITNEQMKITSVNLISRLYTPVTSEKVRKVIYNFDYDTTGMNTDKYSFPINIYLGDGSNPYAVGIYIRGNYVDNISPNKKILDTNYYGKYSMKIIVNLDATPKTYDVYVYNQSKTQIGSLLNQTYSTTSFDRISFKNYSTNSNYLLVDNISVNNYTVLLTNPTPSISNNATAVSVDTSTIGYTFNNPINPTTLSGITIQPEVNGLKVELDSDSRKVNLIAPNGFNYDTKYTITITTMVKDIFGGSLTEEYKFYFTTESPPVIMQSGSISYNSGNLYIPVTNKTLSDKYVYIVAAVCTGSEDSYFVKNAYYMKRLVLPGATVTPIFSINQELLTNEFVKVFYLDSLLGGNSIANEQIYKP